ncbi:MAG: hypothetical protein ABEK59_03705 [Halobacteria archaeon]
MTDPDAPLVPDLRDKSEVTLEKPDVDREDIQEEIEHLRKEVPFVPVVEKRRNQVVKETRKQREDQEHGIGVADLRKSR